MTRKKAGPSAKLARAAKQSPDAGAEAQSGSANDLVPTPQPKPPHVGDVPARGPTDHEVAQAKPNRARKTARKRGTK